MRNNSSAQPPIDPIMYAMQVQWRNNSQATQLANKPLTKLGTHHTTLLAAHWSTEIYPKPAALEALASARLCMFTAAAAASHTQPTPSQADMIGGRSSATYHQQRWKAQCHDSAVKAGNANSAALHLLHCRRLVPVHAMLISQLLQAATARLPLLLLLVLTPRACRLHCCHPDGVAASSVLHLAKLQHNISARKPDAAPSGYATAAAAA
jgi:hypothetical protein